MANLYEWQSPNPAPKPTPTLHYFVYGLYICSLASLFECRTLLPTTATCWYGKLFPLTQAQNVLVWPLTVFVVCSSVTFWPRHMHRCWFFDVGFVCHSLKTISEQTAGGPQMCHLRIHLCVNEKLLDSDPRAFLRLTAHSLPFSHSSESMYECSPAWCTVLRRLSSTCFKYIC